MAYCELCGKELNGNEKCTCPGAKNKNNSSQAPAQKNIKKLLIPIAVVIALIIGVVCVVSYIQAEVDLSEYIVIEGVEGLNTQGVINYSLNEKALYALMVEGKSADEINEENFKSVMMESISQYEDVSNALKCITLSASPETGLSNGDKVTVTVAFENIGNYEFDFRFTDGTVEYTVEGLSEGIAFDPFSSENINVNFSGFSGNGEAEVEIIGDDEMLNFVTYSISPNEGLKNGDTVTVSLDHNPSFFEEMGYFAPEQVEVDYEVTGLDEYFKPSQGFPEGDIDMLKGLAIEEAEEKLDYTEWDIDGVSRPEIIGCYFMEANDLSNPHKDYFHGIESSNAIAIVTHSRIITGLFKDTLYDAWYVHVFSNCYLDEVGHIAFDEESIATYNTAEYNAEDVYKWLVDEFDDMTISKISE